MTEGKHVDFVVSDNGLLRFRSRICVPTVGDLRKEIMTEVHSSSYSIHPGSTKMYRDLHEHFWWKGMKRDIAEFVGQCLVCQLFKVEHQKPSGKLQPLPIPKWKWDHITMDFVCGLPRTSSNHDEIWVVVDRLTKLAHFIIVHMNYSLARFA